MRYNDRMRIKELVQFGHREFIAFDSARLDAELLLSHVLMQPVTYVLAHDDEQVGWLAEWRYKRLVSERKKGMPVAYLRGHREFYGLDFKVNRHTLVPRPDTEALVEAVIAYLSGRRLAISNKFWLLDVGTGSGCIPISVLRHVSGLTAVATDISSSALRVAKANAKRHEVEGRIKFYRSDLLKNVDLSAYGETEWVVTANLPYVPKGFRVNIETQFEPQIALWGGEDGMEVYRRLLKELLPLKPRAMFFECFDFQKAILAAQTPGYRLRHVKSLSGGAAVMVLERS